LWHSSNPSPLESQIITTHDGARCFRGYSTSSIFPKADAYFLDHKLPHVPGTVLLDDYAAQTEDITHSLKHATGSDAHIVLSPQPSEDPNDPLNWPKWKKELIVAILCLGSMLNAGTNVSTICFVQSRAYLYRGHFSTHHTSP
jgi:hypothetical protein